MLINNRKATACVPVIENNDNHPFRAKRISKGKFLKSFFKFNKKISSNRQDLEKNYFLCHNFWTIKTDSIFKKNGEFSGTCASQSPFLNKEKGPCGICGKLPDQGECKNPNTST